MCDFKRLSLTAMLTRLDCRPLFILFSIFLFFLHLLCCFLFFSLTPFQLLPVRKISWPRFPHGTPCESFSQRRQRGETKASHMQHPFFSTSLRAPFRSPFLHLSSLSSLSVCVFLHISHGGQVKNSVICSTASQLATNATRS